MLYSGYGAVIYKEYAINCINYLLGTDKRAEVSLPSTGRITLTEQSEEKRNILHLLYANTIGRGGQMQFEGGNMSTTGKNVELIDALIPLYNIEIKVKPTIDNVSKVTLEPQGEEIGYTQGIGLSYNIEFDTFKEFLEIIIKGKKKMKKEVEKKVEEEQKENPLPNYVKFKKKSSQKN